MLCHEICRYSFLNQVSSSLRRLLHYCADEEFRNASTIKQNLPYCLPFKKRYITTLIIDHAHSLFFHQGVRSTLALLSSEYLVRRRTVLRVVQTCTRCRRYRALPYTQTQGALPSFRTQPSRSVSMHLNLRPVTEDITDGLLTPAHFLFGVTHIQGVISPSVNPTTALDRAWRNRKRVAEHLIKRWTDEYLQTLRAWSTSPRGRSVRVPQVGEVVLVQGEGSRGRWPLARVQALIEGRDGTPRAAVVTLRGRQTRRPVTKLYRLEASSDFVNCTA